MSWIEKKAYQEKAHKLYEDAAALLKGAASESRSLTNEEDAKWNAINKDADEAQAMAERIHAQEKNESRSAEQRESYLENAKRAGDTKGHSRNASDDKSLNIAFKKYLRNGAKNLSDEERHALSNMYYTNDEGEQYEQRAVSGMSSNVANEGAEFVPQGFWNKFVEVLADSGNFFDSGPEVFSTASGNDLPIPIINDESEFAEVNYTQGTAVTDDETNDPATSNITLKGWMIDSGVVRVSLQLLQDSYFPIDKWLGDRLFGRVSSKISALCTTGSGTNEPKGAVTASTLGVTAAAYNAVTYNELLDLKHSLKRKHQRNAKYMFNDNTHLALKKLVETDTGRLLWERGDVTQNVAPTIDGTPYIVNQDMASMGLSAKSILCGDFSAYLVRLVAGGQLVRFEETYMKNLEKGFMYYQRVDGNLPDTSAIKHLINAASSV